MAFSPATPPLYSSVPSPGAGGSRDACGILTAVQLVLKVHRHIAQKTAVDNVRPLDGVYVAEDRIVVESHGALQDFCVRKEPE